MIAAGTIGTRAPPTAKPRPCSRSQACTPEAVSSPKAEPPDSAMASMPSTVCAGSSNAVSRVPGPPPRTSIEATAGSSKMIAVAPEPRRASVAWPIFSPGTSVIRLRKRVLASRPTETIFSHASTACACLAGTSSPITSSRGRMLALASRMPAGHECAMPNVTIVAALVAGMLSFLSPCVLPLVPPYLVYLTGTSLERFADAEAEPQVRREAIAAALLFVLGFSTVFVALGASASAIGAVLRAYSGELAILAGIAIIIMGLHFLGVAPIAWLMREKRVGVAKPVGLWGAYLMGLAFAIGWTPCIGPILAAILAVAASQETVAKGAGMLAVYSLGLGVPFIVAALAVEPFAAFLARFRAHLGLVEKAMGGLLVLTGVAFLTGIVGQASFWLLDTFPVLGKIG